MGAYCGASTGLERKSGPRFYDPELSKEPRSDTGYLSEQSRGGNRGERI